MDDKIIKALQKNKKPFKNMSKKLQEAALEIGKPNFLFWHNFEHKWCEQCNGLIFSPDYKYRLRANYL